MSVRLPSRRWLAASLGMTLLATLSFGTVSFAQSGEAQQVFLPSVIVNPTIGTLVFASRLNPDRSPQNPGTSFPYGITDLFISVPVSYGQGLGWRTEWYVDGEYLNQLDGSGSIGASPEHVSDGICGVGANGQCGAPVPRGTYEVRFYLDGALVASGSAEIK